MENNSREPHGMKNVPSLADKFGRTLSYLRLAVTERCNLRCSYCMPESGIHLKPKDQILSYEELIRLVNIVVNMGVTKVRVTGGEPMVRKDIIPFLQTLSDHSGLNELHLTSNGFWSQEQIKAVTHLNLSGINLSLDTLIPERFMRITRRDAFQQVWQTLQALLETTIPIKLNAVIQRGINDDEILALSRLAEQSALQVRFIEEMPFNGGVSQDNPMSANEILAILHSEHPAMRKISPPGAIATLYEIPGFMGQIGIIAGYSRTFCSACSRMRITSTGELKTCLYEAGGIDLRPLIRAGASDEIIAKTISRAIHNKAVNGFEAEKKIYQPISSSMSTIGG